VVSSLRDEPSEVPSGLLAGCMDDGHHNAAIGDGVDVMLRGLMGVGLSLVPEECAKAVNSELVDAQHHPFEELTVADEGAGGVCSDVPRHGGHDVYGGVCGQPLTDAGGTMTDGGDADGDMVSAIEGVAEGRDEAAFAAFVLYAGLGVVGEGPFRSAETGDHSGLGRLRHFAVVGGVGLAGDDEDLSDTDVRDSE